VRDEKQWIWKDKAYPHFEYDLKKLDRLIETVSRKQGELMVLSRVIGQENLKQSQLNALENEIISSSAIEGEILDRDSVKSSIKEKLEIEVSESYRERTKESNYVDILLDANSNYEDNLSLDKLFTWHYKMFENHNNKLWNIEVGNFRKNGTMQIISGVIGKAKVYYEAPSCNMLDVEMKAYIDWFNSTPSSLMKSAISHLWFVIIHPFDDGNGRLTRLITDMVLSKLEESTTTRLYSMSRSIKNDRKGYYNALERTTGYLKKDNLLDITFWCEWFLKTLANALVEAIESIEHVVDKAKFWDRHRESAINERQTKVLNIILDRGVNHIQSGLTSKKYMKMAQTTSATASRDIKGLLTFGCIEQVEGTGGRNVRYLVLHK
jgi:Fic family protein